MTLFSDSLTSIASLYVETSRRLFLILAIRSLLMSNTVQRCSKISVLTSLASLNDTRSSSTRASLSLGPALDPAWSER